MTTTQGIIWGEEGRYATFYPDNDPNTIHGYAVPIALWKLHRQRVTAQMIGHTVVSIEANGQRWECDGERLEGKS